MKLSDFTKAEIIEGIRHTSYFSFGKDPETQVLTSCINQKINQIAKAQEETTNQIMETLNQLAAIQKRYKGMKIRDVPEADLAKMAKLHKKYEQLETKDKQLDADWQKHYNALDAIP